MQRRVDQLGPTHEGLAWQRRPGSPTAEAAVSNSVRCGFESHPGHTFSNTNASCSDALELLRPS
jgi:hypothetical protein